MQVNSAVSISTKKAKNGTQWSVHLRQIIFRISRSGL